MATRNDSTLQLPPAAAIADAIAELTCSGAADPKRIVALNKAQYALARGIEIVAVPGAFLVPSTSRGGLIHRVDHVYGCSCEAGSHGRPCQHRAMIEVIERAQIRTMPALTPARSMADRIATARQATALLNECF